MRVISQNGRTDVPYEKATIVYVPILGKHTIGGTLLNKASVQLAEYSTEEKALKAMGMLIEQYKNLEVFKVLACGTTEHMERVLTEEELQEHIKAFYELNAFRFPQDSEVKA